jgi:hypothetical protein
VAFERRASVPRTPVFIGPAIGLNSRWRSAAPHPAQAGCSENPTRASNSIPQARQRKSYLGIANRIRPQQRRTGSAAAASDLDRYSARERGRTRQRARGLHSRRDGHLPEASGFSALRGKGASGGFHVACPSRRGRLGQPYPRFAERRDPETTPRIGCAYAKSLRPFLRGDLARHPRRLGPVAAGMSPFRSHYLRIVGGRKRSCKVHFGTHIRRRGRA